MAGLCGPVGSAVKAKGIFCDLGMKVLVSSKLFLVTVISGGGV